MPVVRILRATGEFDSDSGFVSAASAVLVTRLEDQPLEELIEEYGEAWESYGEATFRQVPRELVRAEAWLDLVVAEFARRGMTVRGVGE